MYDEGKEKNMYNSWTLLLLIATAIVAIMVMSLAVSFSWRKKRKVQQTDRLLQDINAASPYRKPAPLLRPHNEKLWEKDLKKEQRQQLENNIAVSGQVSRYNPDGIEQSQAEDVQIVGVAEAKGFWSRFVMSQKMGYIMARMSGQRQGQGFWVNLIKANAASQGKDQSRGR